MEGWRWEEEGGGGWEEVGRWWWGGRVESWVVAGGWKKGAGRVREEADRRRTAERRTGKEMRCLLSAGRDIREQ